MQQIMTRWIEAADARAACEEAMAAQMLATPPEPAIARSLAAMLRLPSWLHQANPWAGLGSLTPDDH